MRNILASVLVMQVLVTHGVRLPRRAAAAGLSGWLAAPRASRAASVSYDFGYRLNRALDPEFRGPADDNAVSDALSAMCNPPPPPVEESAAAAVAAGKSTSEAPSSSTASSSQVSAAANGVQAGKTAGAAAAAAVSELN